MHESGRRRARSRPGPAIGPGGPLPPGVRRRRLLVAFSLVLLLGLAKSVIPRAAAEAYLATGPGRLVAAGLIVGTDPTDGALLQLTESIRLRAVVNAGSPSVAEQATAAALHLAYLRIPVPPGGSPTWHQLRVLVSFMRVHTMRGDFVYLHDCDCGDGQATSTAAMLLLMHGESWRDITAARLGPFDRGQRQALGQLVRALRPGHRPLPGNPYSAARADTW